MKIKNHDRRQDYKTMKENLLSRGLLFEDDTFPPSKGIEWLRPNQISKNPQMYVEKRNRFDINQGRIGNCWFLAALAQLADDDEAYDRVVPRDQSFSRGKYCGMFRFRFFRFGEWVEIVVDDRLPTRNGKLIYLRSKEDNEFWSPLLEKAYAKLYGSYEALDGGNSIEAAVDFTGGIPEVINISKYLEKDQHKLFNLMRKADANNAFITCGLDVSRILSILICLLEFNN